MVKCACINREGKNDTLWLSIRARDEEHARSTVIRNFAGAGEILRIVPSEEYESDNGGRIPSSSNWRKS
jgi:hypothetical protein